MTSEPEFHPATTPFENIGMLRVTRHEGGVLQGALKVVRLNCAVRFLNDSKGPGKINKRVIRNVSLSTNPWRHQLSNQDQWNKILHP